MNEKIFDNLELTHELLEVTFPKFSQGQYTDAIKDAFLFLTTYIRETSGETGDGVNLISKVFGGKAPLIKVNSLTTDTEQSIQEGIHSILRGLYQGFRNPRNHEQFNDDEQTCLRILVMVDTIYKYVKDNTQNFSVENMVRTVFDPFFVESREYADSLVSNIPEPYRIEIFKQVLDKYEDSDRNKVAFFIMGLYRTMNQEKLEIAAKIISEKMRGEDQTKTTYYLKLLRPDMWNYIPTDIKIRTENMIITEVAKGEVKNGYVTSGHGIGTWGGVFAENFGKIIELRDAIKGRLRDSWFSQDFISKFYIKSFPAIFTDQKDIEDAVDGLIYASMVNRANGMRRNLPDVISNYPQNWKLLIENAVKLRMVEDEEYAEELLKAIKPSNQLLNTQ
jgi:uncharacterized protein (TIGR02391 family)